MTNTAKFFAVVAALLFAASPAEAAPCAREIARAQAHLDAAIEESVAVDGWKPESLDATRGRQPTPRSLAQAAGGNGFDLQIALDTLDRARAADRSGNIVTCRQVVAGVQSILRQRKR